MLRFHFHNRKHCKEESDAVPGGYSGRTSFCNEDAERGGLFHVVSFSLYCRAGTILLFLYNVFEMVCLVFFRIVFPKWFHVPIAELTIYNEDDPFTSRLTIVNNRTRSENPSHRTTTMHSYSLVCILLLSLACAARYSVTYDKRAET